MLIKAVYEDEKYLVSAKVERIDVFIKSEKEVLNFPRIIELDGERLVLVYGRGRHGGKESRPAAISEDLGQTWCELGDDSPWTDDVQTSGILGYFRDGTIAYINVFPQEAYNIKYSREDGPWHDMHKVSDPTFKIRRFKKTGELQDTSMFKLMNVPWRKASYELYGSLLELDGGSYMTAFQALPDDNSTEFSVGVWRSVDNCKTFEMVHVFDPAKTDLPKGNQGFCEPDIISLANGDLLCVMRTGGRTQMFQSRSRDGGSTWSDPVSVGWPGVKPCLKLLSNGVLVCTAGRGYYGNPQITYAMFSLDGTGERWEYPMAFHTGPGCSYTSNMEREGKLYVIYSDSDFSSQLGTNELPYQSIKCAVINVEKEDK